MGFDCWMMTFVNIKNQYIYDLWLIMLNYGEVWLIIVNCGQLWLIMVELWLLMLKYG